MEWPPDRKKHTADSKGEPVKLPCPLADGKYHLSFHVMEYQHWSGWRNEGSRDALKTMAPVRNSGPSVGDKSLPDTGREPFLPEHIGFADKYLHPESKAQMIMMACC